MSTIFKNKKYPYSNHESTPVKKLLYLLRSMVQLRTIFPAYSLRFLLAHACMEIFFIRGWLPHLQAKYHFLEQISCCVIFDIGRSLPVFSMVLAGKYLVLQVLKPIDAKALDVIDL